MLALLVVATLTLLSALAPAPADAAARTFANSYAQTLHGDIAAIGNSNSTCRTTWTNCSAASLTGSNNNQGQALQINVDTTQANSSSSTLNIPAGAVVKSARLVWGSSGDGVDNATDKTVKFDTPATAGYAYTSVTATAATCGFGNSGNNRGFGCAADVTTQVGAAGNGSYTVANIEQRGAGGANSAPDAWSGWGLYVVYELPTEPLRRLVLADGFQIVGAGAPATVTANGFIAPASGAVSAQLTYMVGEGDPDITGDNATFGSKTLDGATPAATANLMNSTIRGLTYEGTRTPSNLNNYGLDIHQDEVNGAIPNAATSANFSFTSAQDVYFPFALGIAIDLGEPNLVLTKTLTDVNGGVVEPGDVLEYQIVAQNTGNDGAAQVTLTDPIPAGTAYVPGSMQVSAGANVGAKTDAADTDQATFAGNQVTMRLGTGASGTQGGVLAAGGGTSTVKFRVKIDANSDEGVPLVNTASGSYVGQTSLLAYADPSSVAATPVRRADLVVAQTLSPNLTAGQAGTVTLTASNIGGATTLGQPITVTETLPAGVTFGGVTSAAGWTCNTASLPTITCTRTDTLAATSSYPDIVVAITPSQTVPTATFGAKVAGGNEVNTGNDTDSDNVTFARSANLSLTKTVDQAASRVGDTLTYTLAVKNDGPSNTTGVSVADPLSANLQYVSSTSTSGLCSNAGQNVTCSVGALTSGATATITIKAKVLAAAAGSTIANGATISGSDPDPTPGNNTDTVSTTIGQIADLHVTTAVSPAAVNPGAAATWTITVLNQGTGPATAAQISNAIPAGFTVDAVTPSVGTCATGSPLVCSFGTIAGGDTVYVQITGRATLASAGTTLTTTSTSSTSAFDSDPSDDAASSGLTVNPAADITVTKTADKATANVDDLITWTVTLTNQGPSPATGVTVNDAAPAGVTIQSVTGAAGMTCATSGQTVSCSVAGSLASGASKTVTIVAEVNRASAGSPLQNSATGASGQFDPDTSNNLSSVTTNVRDAADLKVTKTADKATADIGDTITWIVTAQNLGASTATNVQVTDVLPTGVTLLTPLPAGCSVVGTQVVCTLASLAANASQVFTLKATVNRGAAGTPQQNVAQITGTEFDPDTANNSTNVTTDVRAATDLGITKTVDKANATVGDSLTYTLVATNDGPSTATGITIADTLPAGFSASAVPTIAGGTCTMPSAQAVLCTLASLPSGGTRTVTIAGTITAAAAGTTLANTAHIDGVEFDQDQTDNTTPAITTNVGGVAELALTKTVDQATGNVGDTLTYTLKVTNAGPQAATGTTLTDTLPASLTRLGATPSQGTCAAGTPVVCSLGTVASGASATVTITASVGLPAASSTVVNSASVTAAQNDTNAANNSASASTTIAAAADLSIAKTADKAAANVGDTINWKITAKNNGPSSATGVSVTDYIPTGVTLLPIGGLPAGVTCTVSGSTVVCAIAGTMTNGSTVTIPLSATVNRSAAETPLQNSATIGGSQLDPDTSNNLSKVTTTVAAASDLRVTKTANKATANVGDAITWTLAVTNDGPSVATNVVLTDDLPTGTTLLTSSITGGGSCVVSGPQLVCTAGTLAPGQTATATITSRVERANAESPVSNTGRATADQLDPDTANNVATAATTVGPSTDLRIAKSVDTATANVGDTITYTLTATNDGPSTATGVVVSDTLPAGLTRTGTATASQGSCNPTGSTLTCAAGTIAFGSTATFTVKAIVGTTAAGTTLSNTASVAGAQSDPTPGNNVSAPATTAVAAAADVAVIAAVDKSSANVGDSLAYTFKATNNGPSTASGFQLVATLPAGVTAGSVSAPGLTCTATTTITCTGSLPTGASATLTVGAIVRAAASGTTQTANVAVFATPFDPAAANNAASISTVVATAADLRITKSVDKATANLGDTVVYTLKADNLGPSTATSVTVTDTVPSSLQIVGTPTATQGTCTVTGQAVSCAAGSIANAASATITITAKVLPAGAGTTISNSAKVAAPEFDPAAADNTSSPATTTVAGAADVAVVTTVDKAAANVGDTLTYTFVATNNGPQTASGFQLRGTLPSGTQLVAVNGPAGLTCNATSPVLCTGSLANGASATLTVTAKVLPAASQSTITGAGVVSATPLDPVTANNTSNAATTIAPAADLSITKTVDKATANIGDNLTFTLKATNNGPAGATGVTITDTLPTTLQIVGMTTVSPSGTCTVSGQAVTCTVPGTLASGSAATATIVAKVLPSAASTTVANIASVAGNETDPTPADNSSPATATAVGLAADVAVVTSVDKAAANVGDTLTYTFKATNNGPQAATGFGLTGTLPAGVTLLTASAPGLTCTGNPVVCTGTLASGASATLTVTARVATAASGTTQTASGAVSASPTDPVPANNTSSTSTTVAPAADLKVTKTVDKATANIGDTLTYTLKAEDLGPANATGVVLSDTLPSSLQIVGTPTATQGTCIVSGQTVTCTVGSIVNGGSATATILAKVLPSAASSNVANSATVDGDQFDQAPGNDSSTPTTSAIGSSADLQVTQTASAATVNVGGIVDYTITVKNNGPQTATAIALTDDLPAGATLVSTTPAQGTCGTGDPFACSLGTLASGASTTVVVRVKIIGAAETTFPNVASATATQFDPDASNNAATAAVSTNPATDLKITKTADKTTADVGDTITWTVTATNSGPSAATGITITDTVPGGVTPLPITGLPAGVTCTTSGAVVSCAKTGSLASGATLTITLKGTVKTAAAGTPQSNSATVAGNEFDPDTSNNLSAVTTNVNGAADLSITKGVDKATANVGDTLNWTVVATNAGPSTATGVVVTDDLPTGVSLVLSNSTSGTCAVSGTQLVCTGITLANGASVIVNLSGKVLRGAAESPVNNVARVTSSVLDPSTANNLSTASTTVGPAADLRLAKSVDKATANVGDTLTYTLTATNDGPSSATGTSIVDTLPTGLQITGTPTSSQGACAISGQTVTCSIGTLANAATATATIKAIVRPAASSTSVANAATVSGSRLDPDPSNNTTTPTATAVGAAADLAVTNTVDQSTLNLGDTATFTIVVKNNGPSTATGVSLGNQLPPGTTLVSRSTTQGSCTAASPVVCTIGTLASGASATIIVKVTLDTGASATFTDKATATANEYEPTPADNVASAATSTGPAANLSLTKTADKATANVGDTITWTLVAKNAGPSAASGVTVSDTIPAGVTNVTASGDGGITCTVGAPAVSCVVPGPWAAGSPRTITLTGKVARGNAGSPLSNQASIAGAEFDPVPADNISTATTDISDAADLSVTKTADKATANVGDTITWTVAAKNDGPSPSTGTITTDDFPAGVTFLSATSTQGTCSLVGAQVVCSMGALASGQTGTATITGRVETANAESPVVNAARVTSGTFDPDTTNNLSTVTTQVGKSIDLTTTAAVNRGTANIGDELIYTFTVANAGPSSAPGVSFTHALPAGVDYESTTSSQGGCALSAGTVTCAVGTVPSGGNATITVKGTVAASAAGTTIDARGAAAATEPDRDTGNNTSAVVSTAVAEAADLAVSTSVDQPSAAVGGTLTYLVTVTNQGPSTASGVQLTNAIPAGTTVVSVTPSQGSCNTADPRSCALGTLAPNASATLTVVVKTTTANAGTALVDNASATADQFDPVTTNNAASAGATVGTAADLRVTKTADKSTANVGDTVTWTIIARNNGPKDATGVLVSDAIPAGITITSATSTAGTCTGGSPITCAVGNLVSGATATITIVGTVDRAAAGQSLGGSATVNGNELDPDLTNNTSPASTTVVGPAADLRVTKVIDKANPQIGDAVVWTIQVFNDGPSAASSAQVTDVVPSGADVTSVTALPAATNCATTGQSVVCGATTIPSGGSITVTITATVKSGAGGSVLDNAATASSATLDPDTTNNTATARAVAGAAADLSISLTPDRPTVTVGEAITWSAVIGNGGPQTATGTVATIALPDGLENVTATVPGGTCVITGQAVTCQVPNVPSGGSAVITLTGTAGRDTAEKRLTASGVVTGSLPDPITNDNTASSPVVTVPAAVDLVVTKTADKTNAAAGEQVTITTTVRNNGPSAATDVVLTDQIPDGVTLASVTPSQGTCTVTTKVITCTLGTIPNGSTVTIAAVFTVDVAGSDQQLLNAGSASSPEFDSDGTNNAAQITATGRPAPSASATIKNLVPALGLTKTVDKSSSVVGGQVVFTINATNHGSAPATGVRIVDQLPPGLQYVATKATGATCTRSALTVTCVVSSLAPGTSATVKITTEVTVAGAPIDNVATATAAGLADTSVKGQRASAQVTGSGPPYVVAGIKSLEPYSRPGKRLRVAVKVTNVGQAGAKGVSACFTLPAGLVLTKKPAGLTQKGAQFCLTAPALPAGKYKRVVLATCVTGGPGTTRPKLTAKATNSRTKVETYPITIRGLRPTKAAGVTG